jgi:hypothetical protein
MFDLPTKVWLANEVRIWGLAVAAILGIISFAATLAQSRWQAELASQNEEVARILQRQSDERIASAIAEAASANARALEAQLALEQFKAPRSLTDEQAATVAEKLKPFAGQEWGATMYWELKESVDIATRIYDALTLAGWKYLKPDKAAFMVAGIAGVQVWRHPDADEPTKKAADSLVSALDSEDIAAVLKLQNPINNPKHNDIHLDVGTKP